MILVDANVLLYAYNSSAEQHQKSRAWLEAAFSGSAPVRFAWVTLLAFLRIATTTRAYPRPFSVADAGSLVASWLELPQVAVLEPTDRHWSLIVDLLRRGQARGSLVMDAHLAALAIEYGATLCTTDRDFARFPGLDLLDPLAS